MWEYFQAKLPTNLSKLNPHGFINPSMEPSINAQKIQAMKKYKRSAALAYNLALYTLTSIITCFFFSSPFWFPSITNHLLLSSFSNLVSLCFNPKFLFVLGNLIVLILVGESKLKQSSSSTTYDIYDEYVARSRGSHHKVIIDGSVKTPSAEEKNHHREEKKKKNLEVRISSTPRGGEEKKKGMRSCKSEVWGEGGMLKMEKKTKGKKEERFLEGEKKKSGMRSSKSAVWSESEIAKMEKTKGKKELDQSSNASKNDEGMKMGMRSSKSAVWSESERVEMESGKGEKEEQLSNNTVHQEEKKMGMRSSRSAVWGESEMEKGEGIKREEHEEKMKRGMRSCRSEIWSESEIVRLGKSHEEEEQQQQLNVLNKRVEDFIARVNKQRLLEDKS